MREKETKGKEKKKAPKTPGLEYRKGKACVRK